MYATFIQDKKYTKLVKIG